MRRGGGTIPLPPQPLSHARGRGTKARGHGGRLGGLRWNGSITQRVNYRDKETANVPQIPRQNLPTLAWLPSRPILREWKSIAAHTDSDNQVEEEKKSSVTTHA